MFFLTSPNQPNLLTFSGMQMVLGCKIPSSTNWLLLIELLPPYFSYCVKGQNREQRNLFIVVSSFFAYINNDEFSPSLISKLNNSINSRKWFNSYSNTQEGCLIVFLYHLYTFLWRTICHNYTWAQFWLHCIVYFL